MIEICLIFVIIILHLFKFINPSQIMECKLKLRSTAYEESKYAFKITINKKQENILNRLDFSNLEVNKLKIPITECLDRCIYTSNLPHNQLFCLSYVNYFNDEHIHKFMMFILSENSEILYLTYDI